MTRTLFRGLLTGLLLIGIAVLFNFRDHLQVETLVSAVQRGGGWAPALFMLCYALATVLMVPGSLLTLAGGALFGPWWGTLYNLIGATVGATLALLSARYLAGDWVQRKTGGWVKRVTDGVDQEGWRFVALVRLVPLFPFALVNYALGLTRIPIKQYIITSFICMIPAAFAYTYVGFAGREALAGGEGLIRNGMIALALVGISAFLPRLIQRLRLKPVTMIDIDTLCERQRSQPDLLIIDVRSATEYTGELGHIATAALLPLPEFTTGFAQLDGAPQRPVVLVCRTDKRSSDAARIMDAAGWQQVSVLSGGMEAWQRAGLPVER